MSTTYRYTVRCVPCRQLCLNQLACLFRIAAMVSGNDEIEQIADILDCISDLVYCTVCACMQTQHNGRATLGATCVSLTQLCPVCASWVLRRQSPDTVALNMVI